MVIYMFYCFRALIFFFTLFIMIKLLGEKQIKQLTFYDYVIGITIGSMAADTVVTKEVPLYAGIVAIITFCLIGYFINYLTLHSKEIEEVIDGKPIILFHQNQFILDNLDKAKLSVSLVLEHCRLKGCFDINELDCAILETSGDISILLKPKYQNITSNDLDNKLLAKSSKQKLGYNIIVDGDIDEEELERSKKDKEWLDKQLQKNKTSVKEVLLLSLSDNKVSVYKK